MYLLVGGRWLNKPATVITGPGGHCWQMEEWFHTCCKKQCVLISIDWDRSAKNRLPTRNIFFMIRNPSATGSS